MYVYEYMYVYAHIYTYITNGMGQCGPMGAHHNWNSHISTPSKNWKLSTARIDLFGDKCHKVHSKTLPYTPRKPSLCFRCLSTPV